MNKTYLKHLLVPMLLLALGGCKKNNKVQGTASLSFVNAIIGDSSVIPVFTGSNETLSGFSINSRFFYGAFKGNSFTGTLSYEVNSYAGRQSVAIYRFPDTVPGKAQLNLDLWLPVGSIHTLFLTGTSTTPDTLFTEDHPPLYLPSDSVTGIRFVNLSAGSNPVSVNIKGQPAGSETGNLPYKGITEFKRYPATSAISSYTFEFRDAATGNLLTTYTANRINYAGSNPYSDFNKWQFKNSTLAILGSPDSSGYWGQRALLITNY